MLKPTLAALLALVLVTPARAEQSPDGRALLQKVVETYHAMSSYLFAGTIRVQAGGLGVNFDVPWSAAGDRTGRARVDVQNPQMGVLIVCDGKQLYTYRPSLNQYTRAPAPAAGGAATMPLPPAGSPLGRYFDLLKGVNGVEVTGVQAVAAGGKTTDCWVVRADVTPPEAKAADSTAQAFATFWVDRASSLVRRDSTALTMRNAQSGAPMTMQQVTTFDVQRVDESLPDSLFAFVAPAGAQEVQAFSLPGQQQTPSELVGQKAPLFTLADLQGRKVSLAGLRGKVVVLDFWATWCAPCRIEMPRVETLHKEMKSKGVVVLGVNVAEEPALVRRYLAKTPYSFTILLDRQGDAANRYQATGIPTLVVIGKDGRIHSYFQGVRDEDVLRKAVTTALAARGPAGAGRPAVGRTGSPKAAATAPKGTAPTKSPSAAPKPKP